MDCLHLQDLFSPYYDQELAADEVSRLESHLAVCPQCAEEWTYFYKTVRFLNKMEPAPAPADMLAGIIRRIGQDNAPASLNPFRKALDWFRQTDFSIPWPAATAIVLVAFVAMALVKNLQFPVGAGSSPPTAKQISRDMATTSVRPDAKTHLATTPQFPRISGGYSDAAPGMEQIPFFFEPSGVNLVSNTSPTSGLDQYLLPTMPLTAQISNLMHSIREAHNQSPDVLVTVTVTGTSPPGNPALLCQKLLENDSWKTHRYGPDMLLLYIDPYKLPALTKILSAHQTDYTPPWAQNPSYGSPKKLLKVAIRLQ